MKYQMVIACYRENLSWVDSVPEDIDVIVYCKDKDHDPFPNGIRKKIKKIFLPNIGRESDAYLYHIIDNYENLYDTIIFCQGDPFTHSPNFLELLKQKDSFEEIQPLSDRVYLHRLVPPIELLSNKIENNINFITKLKIFSPIFSTYTLQPIHFYDNAIGRIYGDNLDFFKISIGESPIKTLLNMCGFKVKFSEIARWNMAACFSVHKSKILLHSKKNYNTLKKINEADECVGFLIERSWMLIFGLKIY